MTATDDARGAADRRTPAPPRCAHCQAPVQPGKGREVNIDQGTGAAPTLTVHDDPASCARTVPVRRTT